MPLMQCERDLAVMEAAIAQREQRWRELWAPWTRLISNEGAAAVHEASTEDTFFAMVEAMAHMHNARWAIMEQQQQVAESLSE